MTQEKYADRTTILIVDDNAKNLEVLGGFLKKEGMTVEFALDGSAALNWLEKCHFDVILLDIMMPGMNGYEVCSHIKSNPLTRETPVIFITAQTDTESIIKAFEYGAVDYITKPFIQSELLARIKSQAVIKKSNEKILLYIDKIEYQNRNIKGSLEYARNIQNALRSSSSELLSFSDTFILQLPKDIVSGDFYWHCKIEDKAILAVMDCTGHGVPGALMSILGTILLDEIILREKITEPDRILESLRTKIISSLGQDKNTLKVKDTMEGSVIRYDSAYDLLHFSGAFNSMIHIHNNKIKEIRGDRTPVGYYEWMGKFSLKTINIEKGDTVYLFSDGYMDQFGGPESKKIMSKRFREILLKYHRLPMASQKAELLDNLNKWMGEEEQTDDILIAGIRF